MGRELTLAPSNGWKKKPLKRLILGFWHNESNYFFSPSAEGSPPGHPSRKIADGPAPLYSPILLI